MPSHPFFYQSPTYNVTAFATFAAGFTGLGTVTTPTAYSRRVGDCLHQWGKFFCGVPAAVNVQISVGFNGTNANVTVDASKVPPGGVVGNATVGGANTTTFGWYILAPAANSAFVNMGMQSSTINATTANTGSNMIGQSQMVTYSFMVPIVGWDP